MTSQQLKRTVTPSCDQPLYSDTGQFKLLLTDNCTTAQAPGYPHTLPTCCFSLCSGNILGVDTAPRELAGCCTVNRQNTERVSGVLEAQSCGEVQQTHKTVAQLALPLLQQVLSVDAPAEAWEPRGVQAGQDAAYRRLGPGEGLEESSSG